ncbi:MAG: class I tRNA ligase family protein [Candidatus Hodgkinia cicadicola]
MCTALTYTNAKLHVGHIYELIIANVMVDYLKIWYKAKLITGVDDHGRKIETAARSQAVHPIKLANVNANKALAVITKLAIPVSDWVGTAHERQARRTADRLGSVFRIRKWVYKMRYSGWYLPSADVFCSSEDVKFSQNGMYVWNDQPVEWTQEKGIFINYDAVRSKLIAVYRAGAILTPGVDRSVVVAAVISARSVCITRQKTTSYGLRLKAGNDELTLWVWVDALLAYANSHTKNRLHIVGRDVFSFHVTYYVALLLCLGISLPKAIIQHSLVSLEHKKVSKTLGSHLTRTTLAAQPLIKYTLCTKSNKASIVISAEDEQKANAELANALGNLTKRMAKLVGRHEMKLGRLSTSDWTAFCYFLTAPRVVKHCLMSFRLDVIASLMLKRAAWTNEHITKLKLWARSNTSHKLWVYAHITASILSWLKPMIGEKADAMINSLFSADASYTPFYCRSLCKTLACPSLLNSRVSKPTP